MFRECAKLVLVIFILLIGTSTYSLEYECGDVNCSGNTPDISDIVRLIDYLYLSKDPLCDDLVSNVNCSENPNPDISDIVALISFLYISYDPLCCYDTLHDFDGNMYNTVRIGNQWWMKENLRVTHYRNGDPIPNIIDDFEWENTADGAYCNYDNDEGYVAAYGRLYNWFALSDSRNIAPSGWHIPSIDEWNILIETVGGFSVGGGKLKETGFLHWNAPNFGATNEYHFTALPNGQRTKLGIFEHLGNQTFFWKSFGGTEIAGLCFCLYHDNEEVSPDYGSDNNAGLAVRCVRDEVPVVTTLPITMITDSTAESGGEVTWDGGAPVSVKGICWSPYPNPTPINSSTNDGSGTGSFTSFLTDLLPGITYYVRAYAGNTAGTGFGENQVFTTKHSGTVTDIDGNVYKTIKIGNQWWMAENLKTTHYQNGDEIHEITYDNHFWSLTELGTFCKYDNNVDFIETYGCLYNWMAVNDSRNIAPAGWHVATRDEWDELVDYLGIMYFAGGFLKDTVLWEDPNTGATNESHFSALPGGYRGSDGFFHGLGTLAFFWTSSLYGTTTAYYKILYYDDDVIGNDVYDQNGGFSIRCVKD